MMDRMKPLVTSPEVLKMLYESVDEWKRMTDDERKEMIRAQSESWCRQTMD